MQVAIHCLLNTSGPVNNVARLTMALSSFTCVLASGVMTRLDVAESIEVHALVATHFFGSVDENDPVTASLMSSLNADCVAANETSGTVDAVCLKKFHLLPPDMLNCSIV